MKCNEHESKADVLKKHLINLSSTYLQFVGFPKGPGIGTPGRGREAPLSHFGFREPPPVLNKEKYFASSKPGPVINTPLLLFVGLFGLGGAFFPP